MDRELIGHHVLLADRLGKQSLRQLNRITPSQEPPRHVTAVDVDDDIQVEVSPFLRSEQLDPQSEELLHTTRQSATTR